MGRWEGWCPPRSSNDGKKRRRKPPEGQAIPNVMAGFVSLGLPVAKFRFVHQRRSAPPPHTRRLHPRGSDRQYTAAGFAGWEV
jgi:hypothetical protein